MKINYKRKTAGSNLTMSQIPHCHCFKKESGYIGFRLGDIYFWSDGTFYVYKISDYTSHDLTDMGRLLNIDEVTLE